ncbi:MAG TPA: TrbI/VirB10 family protein [Thermoanaerobaculia bacterium]|jgi:type IV secretory pathway VirB10-like protein
MRNPRTNTLLPALLCAAALFTFACNRGEEERAGQVSTARETTSQAEVQPQPQANELRPEPQSVDIPAETPPNVNEQRAELDAQERKLAAKQAELDAREQRLREREQRSRPASPRATAPAPKPEPERRADVTPAPAPEPAREEPRPEPREETPEPPRLTTVTVPAGTVLDAEFTQTVASNTSAPGDSFRARVAHDVTEDGEVVIPAGSEILGEVTEAVPTRKVGGQAKLALRFTDLVLPSGATVPIDASFVQQGRSETGKDAARIGGGAAAGAILGRVLSKGNRSKGAVIGAIIGAAAGTAIASKTPGEEVVIPDGTVVSLKLDNSVEVRISR